MKNDKIQYKHCITVQPSYQCVNTNSLRRLGYQIQDTNKYNKDPAQYSMPAESTGYK